MRPELVLLSTLFAFSLGQSTAAQTDEAQSADAALQNIEEVAATSQCRAAIGHPPRSYMRGMALVFARAVCNPSHDDVRFVSSAKSASEKSDGLTWYDSTFQAHNMSNEAAGVSTLRHAYTLLLDLGVRESSGRYCLGRYLQDPFNTADSAEAGTFRTSWGASTHSALLPEMFARYQADSSGCLLDVFSKNISCAPIEAKNWGQGAGAEWQKLTKSCPAFAAEYAAIVLRAHGGSKGEYGPVRRKEVTVETDCDEMLLEVQGMIESDPSICSLLP